MRKAAAIIFAVMLALVPRLALGRTPYFVDDAGITDKGKIQSADWLSHSDHGENLGVADLIFQPIDNLETTFQAGRDIGHGNNVMSMTWQEKYAWHAAATPDQWASSVAAGLSYDVRNGGFSGAYAYLPVTLTISSSASLNLDAGWQYSHSDDRNFATWGANSSLKVTDSISFVAEVFGRNTGRAGQQAGISWQTQDQFLTADLVYGHDIDGSTGNWITGAAALLF